MYREWDHLLGFGLFGCTFLRFLMICATHNGIRDFLTTTFYFKGDLVLGLLLSGLLYLHIDVVLLLGRFFRLNLKVHNLLGPISFWNFNIDNLIFGILWI